MKFAWIRWQVPLEAVLQQCPPLRLPHAGVQACPLLAPISHTPLHYFVCLCEDGTQALGLQDTRKRAGQQRR